MVQDVSWDPFRGNPLMVQRLGLSTCTAGPWVQSLQGTQIPQVSRHSQEQKNPKQKKKSILPGTSERSQTRWYGHHQNNKREKSKQKGGKEVWITLCHEKFLTLDGPFYVNHTQEFFTREAKLVSVWGQKRLRFTSYSAQRFELSAESQ